MQRLHSASTARFRPGMASNAARALHPSAYEVASDVFSMVDTVLTLWPGHQGVERRADTADPADPSAAPAQRAGQVGRRLTER